MKNKKYEIVSTYDDTPGSPIYKLITDAIPFDVFNSKIKEHLQNISQSIILGVENECRQASRLYVMLTYGFIMFAPKNNIDYYISNYGDLPIIDLIRIKVGPGDFVNINDLKKRLKFESFEIVAHQHHTVDKNSNSYQHYVEVILAFKDLQNRLTNYDNILIDRVYDNVKELFSAMIKYVYCEKFKTETQKEINRIIDIDKI